MYTPGAPFEKSIFEITTSKPSKIIKKLYCNVVTSHIVICYSSIVQIQALRLCFGTSIFEEGLGGYV